MGEVKKDTAAAFWLVWINKNLSAAECKNSTKRFHSLRVSVVLKTTRK